MFKQAIAGTVVFMVAAGAAYAAPAEELPRPSYASSVVVSIELSPFEADEIDYIKSNLNFGLYAWLSLSITGIAPELDWHSNWADASAGIQPFKDTVNAWIQAAKTKNARLHLVLISGLARYRWVYHAAKEEDIRNAQWFNDNKLCADGEIGNTQDALDGYIWGTLSRYARKLRANVEAKGKATLAFLKQRMTEEPETLIALSGWGESELSDDRINHALSVQDWACDYSPFAVLEFRDWLQHAGMYDDVAGAYKGQGYAGGGAKYQGAGGLAQFNADFGQGFTSWDLKYYNWSLADDYDAEPEDAVNNDPHLIPFSSYVHGAMMPTEGPDHTAGGFDPPRVMAPGNAYWDLWNTFREAMVHNFVKDMAGWASEAGIPATQWYSHQIPADYLFGTNPAMMPNLNPRYFTSASPLALADVAPYGSAGVTMYDIAFPGWFARTTKYGVPAAAAISSNWAILEYDAEAYPEGLSVPQSTPDSILQQFLRTYSYRPHLINFFRWKDASFMHQIKGMNKEIALRDFIAAVRDLGRNTDTTFMYAPPKTTGLSGSYVPETAAIRLEVTGKIWSDLDWTWTDWGGFNRFDVYRGTAPNVPTDLAHKIGTTTGYVFEDRTATILIPYYYKVRAVNKNNVAGPASDEIMLYPAAGPLPVLSLDKTALYFGGALRGLPTPAQRVIVRNQGPPETTLNWRTTSNKKWLLVSPPSGSGNAALSVSVNLTGLSIGTYRGKVTVADAGALGSPRTISVALKVYRARGDAKPFGSFDSPVNGSTVMGTIPVSGWALDDVGVARVEIKRDPIAGDDAGSIGADGLVHVGEASFIRGARPDVEAAWKTSPNKDRAGWGTTLLTYDLPGRGNGPLRLHAIATDMGGKKKELGVKSVVADNANNTNPFGMIDTPAHGEVTSGAAFASSAWALTPLSKEIPRDGSTIRILIDSLPAGNPVYNQFRQDVRDAYPEFLNSDGAGGSYIIDTTKFADGVHTIGWEVTDDAGSGAVIGSRAFETQNLNPLSGYSGSSLAAGRTETGPGARLPADDSGRLGIEVAGSPNRAVRELGTMMIRLKSRGGSGYVGWGADETKDLPVGSSLDAKSGIFYWMPAPGFLGRHVLHFAATDGRRRGRPVEVVIDIGPMIHGRASR